MEKIDSLIINSSAIHTCAGAGRAKKGAEMLELGTIHGGAIAIRDGVIIEVGPQSELRLRYDPEKVIDAQGGSICPGFVDPHTHIVYAGDRISEFEQRISGKTYMEIMALGGGIMSTARSVRSASLDEIVSESLSRTEAMFLNGVTTMEVKTGYGLDTTNELKLLNAIRLLAERTPITIIPTFLGAHAVPTEYKHRPADYVDLVINEMLPHAWKWYLRSAFYPDTPFFCDVFCEQNAFTAEQTDRIFSKAVDLGFKIKLHTDEFTDIGGMDIALKYHATSVDHLDVTSEQGQTKLANSESIGVILPGVNFNLGSLHFADGRSLIDKGCAIALSTDINPGSSPTPSIPLIMAIASRYQKLMPAEVLNACTINAAFAVGLGKRVGSLETGKQADLLILAVDDYRKLVYEFGRDHIRVVIKNGEIIKQ
ncbi:MAG TPA: imidazolonepropionase [Anaerolineales bacterium]|nr:imidazolonepropionase [Anaerolineales bacterium]